MKPNAPIHPTLRTLLVALVLFLATRTTLAQPFTDAGAGLTGIIAGAVAWGDYDDDGDLDLVASGRNASSTPVTTLYENYGGTFTDAAAGLLGVEFSALAWGDYDADGDLDLVVAGRVDPSTRFTALYRNDTGTFTDVGAGLTGVSSGELAWIDYDNDGDLDLLASGTLGTLRTTTLYRNDAGTFTDAGAGLAGLRSFAQAWGDYDNDGDLDLALSGEDSPGNLFVRLYENDGGTFTDAAAGLSPDNVSSLAWGDYDDDGDLDLATATYTGPTYVTTLYENDGGTFSDAGAGFAGLPTGDMAWGDYDNDGDLDLVTAGYDGFSSVTTLYENDGGTFSDAGAGLTGVSSGDLAWGDYDNDGDLDLVAAGFDGSTTPIMTLYTNNALVPNTRPAAPTGLSATRTADGAVLAWTAALDAQTPTAGLSYNLIVGTAPLSPSVKSPMACRADAGCGGDGYRKVAEPGNANGVTSYTIEGLAPGTYFWSVQAIDHAFAASLFAPEGTFTVLPPFSDAGAGLTGVFASDQAWGDYDNDGDLDLVVIGYAGPFTYDRLTTLYRNDGGTFTDAGAGLVGVGSGDVAWGDYDNDGDLDLVIAGYDTFFSTTRLYRNDAGTFTLAIGLGGATRGALAWGDYDNDGDLDLVVSGETNFFDRHTKIYRNDAGSFTDAGAGLTGVFYSDVAWGDYDDDGDLDLVVSGYDGSGAATKLYRNDGGTFTDAAAGLTGVIDGALAWGDYDADGDLDLVVSGQDDSNNKHTTLYENDGGTFTDAGAGLPGIDIGALAWGDADNDGDLDLALSGRDASNTRLTRLYRNDGGTFTDAAVGLEGVGSGDLAWGDADNDGDLDLALSGQGVWGNFLTRLYTNNALVPNTRPAAPTGLSATPTPDGALLAWSAALDAQTLPAGLSYNLIVGAVPLSPSVKSPMACRADTDCGGDGYRKVAALGNANQVTGYAIKGLAPGTYFWSVQAVDAAFAGSPFAQEGAFTVEPPRPPLEVTLTAKKPPVVLSHRGGKFAFNLRVKNVSDTKQRFQGWFVVTFPDGSEQLIPTDIRAVLQPGRHRGWQAELKVPRSAPSGTYRFTGRVGTYPDDVVHEDWITFVKNPPTGGKVDETGELITAWQVVDETTGLAFVTVEEEAGETAEEVPASFSLSAAYPNPFNPSTEIGFSLPEQAHVRLTVYDGLGREVTRLVDGVVAAGVHGVRFEAGGLPSGVYVYRLEAGRFSQTRRMLLIK